MDVFANTDIDPAMPDRRRRDRVKVRVTGRFMCANRQEFDCATVDLSPTGITFLSDASVNLGERIVAYLVHFGRLEGTVMRSFPGGFAILMRLPDAKRAKLAQQLAWHADRELLGQPEERRHDRIEPRNSSTTLTLANGRAFLAKLVDVSQSGAAVAVEVRPPIGELVTVGSTPARVARLFDDGVAVEFARIIPAAEFDENVVL